MHLRSLPRPEGEPQLNNKVEQKEDQLGGAQVHSRALFGLEAHPVQVECHIASGLPSTTIVGLPQGSVREARDRVRSAIRHLGFSYPRARVVINLAPAEISKSGTGLDLPIAISLLAASAQIPATELQHYEWFGELGLFGELRPVPGAVACLLAASDSGRRPVLPAANAAEAQLLSHRTACLVESLTQATALLTDKTPVASPPVNRPSPPPTPSPQPVVGQHAAKRALQIAAAGGHHLLMVGPPGTGKTLLAQNLRCLLPALSSQHVIEVAKVYSACGLARDDYHSPPFRAPHHSASSAALIGGGNPPSPGELALAHQGVLFLDEVPHFKPSALNLLREPLESGEAVISRVGYKVRYPCAFQLVAAMNPCPAGRTCRAQACRCDPGAVQRYQSRLSGPILDRIDLHVPVPELAPELLRRLQDHAPTDWSAMREEVVQAQRCQLARQGVLNVGLGTADVRRVMDEADVDQAFLDQAIQRYQLSARSYHKLWRIARTIADLEAVSAQVVSDDQPQPVQQQHMTEALSFRALDWEAGVRP